MAIDTWMLVLGLLNIDEEVGHTFLPQSTMVNIGETFVNHTLADRQMLMLAMHRLVLHLLSAMAEAVQNAMQHPRGGDRDMVTVAVEDEEDDDTMWMQLPPVNDWWPLLNRFMAELDQHVKTSQRCMSEWLLGWLSHRCTDERRGYLLGHMTGRTADLTAVLVTYSGSQCSEEWARCSDDEVRWCMTWAQQLQHHLELHPGSRQARGLAPQRAPVMLSPVPIPDALLFDEDLPVQTLHGGLPAHQLDRALEVESSGQDPSQLDHDQAVMDYLAGLRTPTSQQPSHKTRAVMVELSSSSTDAPARVIRLPVPAEGELSLTLRVWTEAEVDQDGIATRLVEAAPDATSGNNAVDVPTAPHPVEPTQAFTGLVGPALVQALASMQPFDEDFIVAQYGWDLLRDVQVCRALVREGTQLDDSLQSREENADEHDPVGLSSAGDSDVVVSTEGAASGMLRPSQEENASSGASIFDQGDPASG